MKRQNLLILWLILVGLTGIIIGIIFGLSAAEKADIKPKKYGFVHVNHLLVGHKTDWSVIDNDTNLPISFKTKERDQNVNIQESDHILISEYIVEWADDKQGIVGGFKVIRIYGKSYPESGFNVYSHTFSEKRDITILYKNDAN